MVKTLLSIQRIKPQNKKIPIGINKLKISGFFIRSVYP